MKKSEISSLPLINLSRGAYHHESYEEWVFAAWCKILLDDGVILECYRPDPIKINGKYTMEYIDISKKKPKDKDVKLVSESAYKPDMLIRWNPKYHGIYYINAGAKCKANPSPQGDWVKRNHLFYCPIHNLSYVDVKGTFKNPAHIPFSRTQQLMITLGKYIQKVVPLGKSGLFAKTFAPKEHLFTPVTKKRRKGFLGYWEFKEKLQSITDE